MVFNGTAVSLLHNNATMELQRYARVREREREREAER